MSYERRRIHVIREEEDTCTKCLDAVPRIHVT
jgi:hypothetical protein